MESTLPLAVYNLPPRGGRGVVCTLLEGMMMANEFIWDDSHDEHGFYIGGEDFPTASAPAERRDDQEMVNDQYFEMRAELNGWE